MSRTKLQELSEHGQSVWLDYLSRGILESGKLAGMMERDAVVGVTSNPTIFQKAIAEGDKYDEQLKELLEREDDLKEIFLALSAEDIKEALALLRPAFDASYALCSTSHASRMSCSASEKKISVGSSVSPSRRFRSLS